MKKKLAQLFTTKVGLFIFSTFFCFVFGILNNWFEWAYYPFLLFGIYPILFVLTMILYAWILNPIREYRLNKKNK